MKTSSLMMSFFAAAALLSVSAVAEETAAVTPTVQAAPAPGWHGHRHFHQMACRSDVKKLCADVRIGDGRAGIESCLASHETELSSACSTQRATFKARKAEFQAACGHDMETLCASAVIATEEPREHVRGAFQCLKAHEAQLSDSCKTYRAEKKAQHVAGMTNRVQIPPQP